jgi:hypothetical protein
MLWFGAHKEPHRGAFSVSPGTSSASSLTPLYTKHQRGLDRTRRARCGWRNIKESSHPAQAKSDAAKPEEVAGLTQGNLAAAVTANQIAGFESVTLGVAQIDASTLR